MKYLVDRLQKTKNLEKNEKSMFQVKKISHQTSCLKSCDQMADKIFNFRLFVRNVKNMTENAKN